jgi:hypothetical protein
VARHIDNCAVCSEQRRRVVSPLTLLSGVPLLPAPEYLRQRVLDDVALVSGGGAASGSGGAGAGGRRRGVGRMIGDGRVALVVGAAGLTLLMLLGALLVSGRRWDAPVRPEAAARPTSDAVTSGPTAGQTGASGTGGTTATSGTRPLGGGTGTGPGTGDAGPAGPAAAVLDLLTPAIDLGATATDGVLRFRNTGGLPLPWSVTSGHAAITVQPSAGALPPGDTAALTVRLDRAALQEGAFAARLRLTATNGVDVPITAVQERPPVLTGVGTVAPWLVPASTCDRTRATAVVSDETEVTVTLHWGHQGGLLTVSPMSGSGGNYSATVGPVSAAGDVRWWVTATDRRGNTSRSPDRTLPVHPAGYPCP